LVIDGQRNLSPHSVEKFAKAFKLNKRETRYFRELVQFNQAKSIDEKMHFVENLSLMAPKVEVWQRQKATYHYYLHWYMVPLRELVGTSDFQEDLQWISRRFKGAIREREVQKGLLALLQLGMIQRDPDGTLRQKQNVVQTEPEVYGVFMAQFHQEMIKQALDSIEKVPGKRREISSLTFSTDQKTFHLMKQEIHVFKQKMIALIENETEGDEVYQFNFQLFPLTQSKDLKIKEQGEAKC